MRFCIAQFLGLFVSASLFAAGSISRPFLYEISSAKGVCGYVLGSVHAGVSSQELPPVVFQKMRLSKVVVLETDFEGDISVARKAVADLYASVSPPEGWRLSERLSPEAWEILQREVTLVAPEVLDRMHPFQASLLMMLGNTKDRLDLELIAMAKQAEIPVSALEKVQDVTAAFGAFLERDPLKALAQLEQETTTFEETRLAFGDLVESYRAGDEGGVVKFVERDRKPEDKLEALLEDRNEKWLDPFIGFLEADQQSPPFVIVGVAHLPGDGGLIALLKARGYEVRRIKQ